MAGKVKVVPEGLHTLTPHLSVRGGDRAIEFYKQAFGAEVKGVHHTPDGKVMHAGLKVGDIILSVNGQTMASGDDLTEILIDSSVGDVLDMQVYRERKTMNIKLKLERRSQQE